MVMELNSGKNIWLAKVPCNYIALINTRIHKYSAPAESVEDYRFPPDQCSHRPPPPKQRCPLSGPLIDSLWTDASQVSFCVGNRAAWPSCDRKHEVWHQTACHLYRTLIYLLQLYPGRVDKNCNSELECHDSDPHTWSWASFGLQGSISTQRIETSYTSSTVFLY